MYFSLTVQYNSLPKISFCQPLKSRFIDSYGLCIDFYYCDPPPQKKKKKINPRSTQENQELLFFYYMPISEITLNFTKWTVKYTSSAANI